VKNNFQFKIVVCGEGKQHMKQLGAPLRMNSELTYRKDSFSKWHKSQGTAQ
jgi:hypothetical protein